MTGKRIEADEVVDAISLDRAAIRERLTQIYASLPRAGYALPMAWRSAVRMSNQLVDAVPRYSSADHGSALKSLLATVHGILATPGSEFGGPYFDITLEHDEAVEGCLNGEYRQLAYLNLEISLRERYWLLAYETKGDSFRLSLSPPQRRSALVLLDHKVEFLEASPELRKALLKKASVKKTVPILLATGMREVMFLADAVPAAWRDLAGRIGFTLDEAVRFQAFVQALMETGQLWFRSEELHEGFTEFAEQNGLAPIDKDRFLRVVDFFSAQPDNVEAWGIAVPFIRFGDWLAYWPFVHHVLPPSLTFLSLLMRKHPQDWDNTVGAHLAKVAVSIRAQLPSKPRLLFATTKQKQGIGDIDLGVYDMDSRILLLCEIKTVFDRFRTNYQQSNFTGQRVNFTKAAAQLAAASAAIASGAWQLSEVFGCKLNGPPARILTLVLTWYDQHNPWLGIGRPHPASCNFRVFQYLFKQADGDLVAIHDAVAQLSRIYCVAALRSWQLPGLADGVGAKREVQTDLLPSQERLDLMPLSDFVRREIKALARLPRDWEDQLAKTGEDPPEYHLYEYDER